MLFSVIIPVHNAEHTIDRCVESVLPAENPDVEILLIDDCSQDGSLAHCHALAEKYENVICLHNEMNRGVSYTRNCGLEAASGEFLLFLDSDDWYDPEYISQFRQIALTKRPKLAICGYVNHDEKYNGRTENFVWNTFVGNCEVPFESALLKLYDDGLLQQLWNKMFTASYVREHRLRFDESISIGEDTRFLLHYLKCCKPDTILLVNQPLYHYMRDQESSLMYHVGYESVDEPIENLRLLYELSGMQRDEIKEILMQKRKSVVELYSYLIMHNAGMKRKEKKKLILQLDLEKGLDLYRKQYSLYWKEKIKYAFARIIQRKGKR